MHYKANLKALMFKKNKNKRGLKRVARREGLHKADMQSCFFACESADSHPTCKRHNMLQQVKERALFRCRLQHLFKLQQIEHHLYGEPYYPSFTVDHHGAFFVALRGESVS